MTGTIDYEEFIAATVNLNRLEQEAAYQAAFQTFDTDGSGCLSVEEIGSALKVQQQLLPPWKTCGAVLKLVSSDTSGLVQVFGVNDNDIKQVLDEVDTNNDGEIDYHGEQCLQLAKHSTISCLLSSKALGHIVSCRVLGNDASQQHGAAASCLLLSRSPRHHEHCRTIQGMRWALSLA